MKKLLFISLVLVYCIGLVSCARSHLQGDVLHPVPISDAPDDFPSSTGRISIVEFNEKEIVFEIWIKLPLSRWIEYIIVDEEENSISEESFHHDKSRIYTRKMKAKEEHEFRKGENYTLHIGRQLPYTHQVYGRFQLLYSYKFVL